MGFLCDANMLLLNIIFGIDKGYFIVHVLKFSTFSNDTIIIIIIIC